MGARVADEHRHPGIVQPLAPRWVSWASVVGAVLLVTANGCAVTKTGPFAWDGVLGYYIPMAIWGIWLDGHAWLVRREVRRLQAEQGPPDHQRADATPLDLTPVS